MKTIQINCFLLLISTAVWAQQPPSSTYYSSNITDKVFTDLRIALLSKENVFRLNLSNQDLKSIPEEIFLFPNLEYLVLDENELSTIQLRPEQLNNLVYFSLKNNKIREIEIPDNCLNLLKELYLDFNELIEFPEINNEIIELNLLSVRYNYITYLPLESLSLSRLTHFYLDSNPLKNSELAFSYSPILERLSLYQTHLNHIPTQYSFGRLSKLVIGDNPIDLSLITTVIFPKLEYLDVSHCDISQPASFVPIAKLKTVKYLIMDDCKIQTIPTNINELKKLREISLIKNKVTTLPLEFYDLKLKLINLEQNPVSEEEKANIKNGFPKAAIHF